LKAFLKTLQRLKQEWQKSPTLETGKYIEGKNLVWFGETHRKLAKLSMPTCAANFLALLNLLKGKV
jgi:hypothetical protein